MLTQYFWPVTDKRAMPQKSLLLSAAQQIAQLGRFSRIFIAAPPPVWQPAFWLAGAVGAGEAAGCLPRHDLG
jgi:hypothetical protein